ncbi:MAG: hypothetical protein KC422_09285 [Trueperaceae bacterium]|nr:hypothetical protein [Trueperaceae bacterium]
MLRFRICSWSMMAVFFLSLVSFASAQDLDCLSQPADHPCWGAAAPSFSQDAVGLAEAVNKENQRRMNEGDCSGLDHEGCLGLQGATLYCWLVGCLTPPDDPKPEPTPEDPTPEDPTPEDPTPEDPEDPNGPGPEDPTPEDPEDPSGPGSSGPKEEPQGQQADTAAEFVGMQSQRFNQKTREVLETLQPGSVITKISWENGTELELVLVKFLETKKSNKREYIAFLDIVDRTNSEQYRIVIGGQGNIVYALPLKTFIRAIRE